MIALLRRLLSRPVRHYIANTAPHSPSACACGHTSYWDWDLRTHVEQTGRIGK